MTILAIDTTAKTATAALCENEKLFWYKNEEDSKEFSKTTKKTFGRPKVEVIEVETDGQNPQHTGIIRNFTNAVLGIEPLMVNGKEGINGVELMNAIELSAWNNGETVTIPVNEKKYLKELKKRCKTSRLKVVDDSKISSTEGTYGSKTK